MIIFLFLHYIKGERSMAKKKMKTTVERRMIIMNKLTNSQQVYVNELSEEFGVSEVTIRNDLKNLEKKKILIRARGGAMKMDPEVSYDRLLWEKDKINSREKQRIGIAAAALIKESDTVIIDSGTTTMEVVKNISHRITSLTIITNALNIANQVALNQNINLIIPGGNLRKNSLSLVGSLAEKSLKNFYVDKVFIGVDGFDTQHGISTPNIDEAHLNQVMIEISKEVIVVTDSSKFSRKSLAFICAINRIHTVVTDSGIRNTDRKILEDAGVKVIIA
jgi:DeoR family transcriptional regulator, aga operon transcriptional repressor